MPKTYALLNLTDLRLGLEDLLTVRRVPLLRTEAGSTRVGTLEQQRQAILALPAPLTGGRPFAEELALRHEQCAVFGMAVWHMTEAYLRTPGIKPEFVEAARRVRHALIPNTERLRDAYPEQAAAAEVRRENIASVAEDLKRLPVVGGGTLHDWAERFVQAGERIAKTLEQRSDVNATTRKQAMTLLADTVQLLNDLRRAVAEEIANTIGMPSETEHQIFGYFDVLEITRLEAIRALEQSRVLAGPVSTRGLTLPAPATRVIPVPPPPDDDEGDALPLTRIIPPARESSSGLSTIPQAPQSTRFSPPPSTVAPKTPRSA